MVDRSNISYKVSFVSFDLNRAYALYKFKIIGPNNIVFHLFDRYSSMKEFASLIKKSIPLRDGRSLPHFPPKKFIGNKGENFLKTRMKSLENFF
jgi:hypothetical protein